jgi:hypothetical protein
MVHCLHAVLIAARLCWPTISVIFPNRNWSQTFHSIQVILNKAFVQLDSFWIFKVASWNQREHRVIPKLLTMPFLFLLAWAAWPRLGGSFDCWRTHDDRKHTHSVGYQRRYDLASWHTIEATPVFKIFLNPKSNAYLTVFWRLGLLYQTTIALRGRLVNSMFHQPPIRSHLQDLIQHLPKGFLSLVSAFSPKLNSCRHRLLSPQGKNLQ